MTPTNVEAAVPVDVAQDEDVRFGTLATRYIRGHSRGPRLNGEPGGTILALHSLGLDRHSFDNLRAALPAQWRLVSYDQRGHGAAAMQHAADLDSYVEDACAALAVCGEEPVHLLGHSMGGAVAALAAATLARRTPGRIASLALVATPAIGNPTFAAPPAPRRRFRRWPAAWSQSSNRRLRVGSAGGPRPKGRLPTQLRL